MLSLLIEAEKYEKKRLNDSRVGKKPAFLKKKPGHRPFLAFFWRLLKKPAYLAFFGFFFEFSAVLGYIEAFRHIKHFHDILVLWHY